MGTTQQHDHRGLRDGGYIECECGWRSSSDEPTAAELEWREHREQETGVPFYPPELEQSETPS